MKRIGRFPGHCVANRFGSKSEGAGFGVPLRRAEHEFCSMNRVHCEIRRKNWASDVFGSVTPVMGVALEAVTQLALI